MIPTTRKSKRKCVQLAQVKKSEGSAKVSINEDETDEGAGSVVPVATVDTSPFKRKRKSSDEETEAEAVENQEKEGKAEPVPVREIIADKVAEIKKIINSIETLDELTEAQLQLLEIRKYVAAKVQEKRVYLEALQANNQQLAICKSTKAVNPLLVDLVLEKVSSFISEADIPSCRLVSTKWNPIFTVQHKKVCWTNLTCLAFETGTGSKEFLLDAFLEEVKTNSLLFPLAKFSISLYVISPGITTFFNIYSNYIKILELRFHKPKERTTTAVEDPANVLRDFERFLLPSLPNCEELYLTAFPCQLLTNTTSVIVSKTMKLKKLEIEMTCRLCTIIDEDHHRQHHSLTSNTFLTKLILANPTLESFVFRTDSQQFGRLNLDQVYIMLLTYANTTSLKHLGLKSEGDAIKWSWFEQLFTPLTQRQQEFQLKSFELKNIAIAPLRAILDHHAKTLEKLCVEIDSSMFNQFSADEPRLGAPLLFNPLPQKFKELTELSLEIIKGQEDQVSELLRANLCPNLEKLKLSKVNAIFVRTHARALGRPLSQQANNDNDGDDDSDHSFVEDDDDELDHEVDGRGSQIDEDHLHIKTLDIEIDDDSCSPTNLHFLRDFFYGVQHLVLTTSQSKFITQIWVCGFKLKSLDLHVSYETEDEANSRNDGYYIQHLDTIITGFSVNDCEKIYQYIIHEFHSTTPGFQLSTFNTDRFDMICDDRDYPSIRKLTTLQRLSVTCSRNSSRLTEVTLVIVLLFLKSLTALTVSNCSISQDFVSKMKEQMFPAFYLDIAGVKHS